jgi:hypothetical protein
VAATIDRSICWHHKASKCIWWQPRGHKIHLVAFIWPLDLFGDLRVTAKSTRRPPLGRHQTAAASSRLFIRKEFYSLYLSIHAINTPTVAYIYILCINNLFLEIKLRNVCVLVFDKCFVVYFKSVLVVEIIF